MEKSHLIQLPFTFLYRKREFHMRSRVTLGFFPHTLQLVLLVTALSPIPRVDLSFKSQN